MNGSGNLKICGEIFKIIEIFRGLSKAKYWKLAKDIYSVEQDHIESLSSAQDSSFLKWTHTLVIIQCTDLCRMCKNVIFY